mmetsp:Transcript_5211/g.7954  ORF Transcript_5211/g.7954 Transcript_5211/m.7954 type:complete len:134 (-) Transcript_5211:159-560(-)
MVNPNLTEEDQAMVKLDLLMVTHTAVAVGQATDHQQAMDKLDLLMDRPPNQTRMAVDQATGNLKDTVDQATGKLKDTADQVKDMADQATGKLKEAMGEEIDKGMELEGTVIWRRKSRRVLQKTKRKPLKHHEV